MAMSNVEEALFVNSVDNWAPIKSLYHSYFSADEISALEKRLAGYNDFNRDIVYVSFENNLATAGGLSRVFEKYPYELAASGERVSCMTPLFKNIPEVKNAINDGRLEEIISPFYMKIGNVNKKITVYREKTTIPIFHIGVSGNFKGASTPYDTPELLEDAIVFCSVVPKVMSILDESDNVVVHSNDWQTALLSLTTKIAVVRNELYSVRTVLTLHNTYDCSISEEIFRKYFFGPYNYDTVLRLSIPFLDAPITTVSPEFATELVNDTLQKELFVPHLRDLFSINAPVGIPNGIFGSRELHKRPSDFYEWKKTKRSLFAKQLNKLNKNKTIGLLKDVENEKIPLLFMSGRFDFNQKGFDIVLDAFQSLPKGTAKLFFSPNLMKTELKRYNHFLKSVAEKCSGDLLIAPFKLDSNEYSTAIAAASYFLMPSIYEPFGSASEAYLNSTPVIARACGGLCSQVVSVTDVSVPSYLQRFITIDKDNATGLLFREQFKASAEDWHSFLTSDILNRRTQPLYKVMSNELAETIKTATYIFQKKKDYTSLIENSNNILSKFTWNSSVRMYKEIYNTCQRSVF